jgi:hypothetical protein
MANHSSPSAITSVLVLLLVALPQFVTAQDKKSELESSIEARAYVFPQCFVSNSAINTSSTNKSVVTDIVGSFVPTLVGTAYSGLVNVLKKAGDPKEFNQKFGAAPFYLYQATKASETSPDLDVAPTLGCVVLVVGTFSGNESPAIQSNKTKESCSDACKNGSEACMACLSKNGIPVDSLNALYEAETHFAADQSALVYQSRYFRVWEWLQSGREKKKHSYVITLSLASPGAKKDDDTIESTAVLDLGNRVLDNPYDPNHLPGTSGWLAGGLGLTDTDKARMKDLASAKKKKGTLMLRPITLYASIAEAAEGSAFAKTLTEILEGAKTDATKAIATAVNPGTILKNAEDQAKAQASDLEKAKQSEETSYDSYLTAKVNLDAATNPTDSQKTELQFKISIARRAWCRDWTFLKALKAAPDRLATDVSQCSQ